MHCKICSHYKNDECKLKSEKDNPAEGVIIYNTYIVMPYDLTNKNKRPDWCPFKS